MLSTSERTLSHSFSTIRAEKRICISSAEIFFCRSRYFGALWPSFCKTASMRVKSRRIVPKRSSAATFRRSRFSLSTTPGSVSSSSSSISSASSSIAVSSSLKSSKPSTTSSILSSSFAILSARSRIWATVIGHAEIARIMCFRPSSIRFAISISPSRVNSSTEPISRMYMREMGSVELLTREGEIEIAKRIEEGLKHMILAISACPMTVAQILDLADKIAKDELKIDDVVDGLLDFNEELTAIEEDAEEIDEDEDETDPGVVESENLERLKVAALERFGTIRRLFTRMLAVLQKEGHKAPKYLDLQKKISAELMQIRFSARMVEKLCDSVRSEVDNIRQIERKIQDLVVNKGSMPRPEFIN